MTNNDRVPELTNSGFDNFIKEGTVLIDFFAEWCMPCVMMEPIVDDLAEEFKGKNFFSGLFAPSGWFSKFVERVNRGVYGLSPNGRRWIREHEDSYLK